MEEKVRILLGKMLGQYSETLYKECDETIEEICKIVADLDEDAWKYRDLSK